MKIIKDQNGGVTIVTLVGNLDTGTSPQAEKEILESIDGGSNKILINLEKTDYISSAGLRVLLASAKKLKGSGEFRISNLNSTVQEVFEVSGFSSILNVDATQEEALAKLQ